VLTVVPLPLAATDDDEFALLGEWLESYKPHEIFDTDVTSAHPGAHDATLGAKALIDNKALRIILNELKTPDWKKYGIEQGKEMSNMKA
jgi:xylulose-5-phosphate/fructose-6-phosphate phosphoketolase